LYSLSKLPMGKKIIIGRPDEPPKDPERKIHLLKSPEVKTSLISHHVESLRDKIVLTTQKTPESKEQRASEILSQLHAEFEASRDQAIRRFASNHGHITPANFKILENEVREIEVQVAHKLVPELRNVGFHQKFRVGFPKINQRNFSTCVATSLMNAMLSLNPSEFPSDDREISALYHQHTDRFLAYSDHYQPNTQDCRSLNDVGAFVTHEKGKSNKDKPARSYHFEQTGSLLDIIYALTTGTGRGIGIHVGHCVLFDTVATPPTGIYVEVLDPMKANLGKVVRTDKPEKIDLMSFSRNYTHPLGHASSPFAREQLFKIKPFSAQELIRLIKEGTVPWSQMKIHTTYSAGILSNSKETSVTLKGKQKP
jgi:hypothetical protein